ATRIAAGLFLSFLTVQSAFIVLAPTLPDVAREFGVSTGTAGQLRTVAAVAGVATALTLAPLGRVVGIRRLLVTGLGVLAAGATASALAPTFALLAVGQVTLGMGGAAVLSAGLAAAGDWPAREQRTRVLAWTTVGQPAAWVLGLPAVGALSHLGWRWGWIVVPAAAAAALAVLPCGPSRNAPASAATGSAWGDPRVRRWAFGEVMAYAGWGGTLVYAGALLSETYDLGTSTVGLLLGAAAVAYFPGTFAARRRLEGDLRALLGGLAIALAFGAAAFGALRPSAFVSTGLFAVLILLAGARGIAGSAFGLNAAPEHKVTIGSIRAAATQLGYLAGAAAGGIALDLGGYPVVGLTLAGFFAAAAVPHLSLGFGRRPLRGAQRALAPIYSEWSGADRELALEAGARPCGG
ncbi:MAG: MFS transporter, partial [Thermoleophilaceae bacterium]